MVHYVKNFQYTRKKNQPVKLKFINDIVKF